MSKPQGVDMRSAACFYQFFRDSLAIIIQFIRANILPIRPFDGVAVCADAAEVSRVSQRAAPLPTRIFCFTIVENDAQTEIVQRRYSGCGGTKHRDSLLHLSNPKNLVP